jgi:tetratricopeptide (TPR) repeat protein
MKEKALNRRRQDPPKDTVFVLGDQIWTFDRIMKSCANDADEGGNDNYPGQYTRTITLSSHSLKPLDEPTPFGMTYHTPRDPQIPRVGARPSTSPNLAQANARLSTGPTTQQYSIRLRWNGHTVTDIPNIVAQAQELERLKDFEGADEKYTETLDAYRNLLPPAHQLTANITYQVARFHARQNSMTRADAILDELTDQFVSQRGQSHASTMSHYTTLAQLLQTWDRYEDVLNLVKRLTDDFKVVGPFPNDGTHNLQAALSFDMPSLLASSKLSTDKVAGDIPLTLQALRVEVGNAAVIDLEGSDRPEQRVLNLLDQLMINPERNLVDIIRTRHLLIEIYCKSAMSDEAAKAFAQAKDCTTLLCRLECHKPKEFFTAAAELAKYGLEHHYTDEAHQTFDIIISEAVTTYGPDHSYTISLLIRIGKVVQNLDSWEKAEAHFEQAYAACITALSHEAFVTRRLEKALEKGYYLDDLDDEISDDSLFQLITL